MLVTQIVAEMSIISRAIRPFSIINRPLERITCQAEAGIRSKPMVLHTHEDELPEAIEQ